MLRLGTNSPQKMRTKGWAAIADHSDVIKHFVLIMNIAEAKILFACQSKVEPDGYFSLLYLSFLIH